MIQAVKKVREPIAWLVVVCSLLMVILLITQAVFNAAQGGAVTMGSLSWFVLGGSDGVMGSGTAALLVLAVASCTLWQPQPRSARALALVAASGATIATVARVVFGIIGLPAVSATLSGPTLAWALVDALARLGTAIGVTWALWVMAKREQPAEQVPAVEAGPSEQPALEQPEPEQQPTWAPDQASGAVWTTAGAAATGSAATQWGTPGTRGGWLPADEHEMSSHNPESAQRSLGALPATSGQPGQEAGARPAHVPRQTQDFGPGERANSYAQPQRSSAPQAESKPIEADGPVDGGASRSSSDGRRQPPVWAPLPQQDPPQQSFGDDRRGPQ